MLTSRFMQFNFCLFEFNWLNNKRMIFKKLTCKNKRWNRLPVETNSNFIFFKYGLPCWMIHRILWWEEKILRLFETSVKEITVSICIIRSCHEISIWNNSLSLFSVKSLRITFWYCNNAVKINIELISLYRNSFFFPKHSV